MQYKQAQVLLSDFLLKCENEGIALPADPLDAVLAAIRALSHETKHEVGRAQMAAAMAAMRQQYGVVKQSSDAPSPRRSKYQVADKSTGAASDDHKSDDESTSNSPPPPRERMTGKSKSKVQQDVVSKRAKRVENQPLVDQLVQLGEFELGSGRTQRGLTRMRAAKQLRDAEEVITSGAQAQQLDRVGPSAAAKVDAILHGGLDNAMREYQASSQTPFNCLMQKNPTAHTAARVRGVVTMNVRQMQRVLAQVTSKCLDLHVQLPVDPFDGMVSAGEALRHSRVGGKFHPDDAVDELKQRYGLEPKWQQIADASEATRRNRQKRHRLRRGDETTNEQLAVAGETKLTTTSRTLDTESAGAESSSDSPRRQAKKPRMWLPPSTPSTGKPSHGSSRIDRIIENNPAKNPANEELAEEFVELGGFELAHGETQKGISRMAVAKQIREAKEPITSGAQARQLPHVGPSAAAKIDEVLHRGKMKALEEYESEENEKQTKSETGGDDNATKTKRDKDTEDVDGDGENAGGENGDHDDEDEEEEEEEEDDDESVEDAEDKRDEDWFDED